MRNFEDSEKLTIKCTTKGVNRLTSNSNAKI